MMIDACCMAAAIRCIVNPFSLLAQHSDGRAADAYRGEQGTRGDWGADRAEPDRPQGLDRAELEVARGEFSHPPSQFTGTREQC